MLAGKTAINGATNPHAAALLVPERRSPKPPRISQAPLKRTMNTCDGM
jgi:hypothetical protein